MRNKRGLLFLAGACLPGICVVTMTVISPQRRRAFIEIEIGRYGRYIPAGRCDVKSDRKILCYFNLTYMYMYVELCSQRLIFARAARWITSASWRRGRRKAASGTPR